MSPAPLRPLILLADSEKRRRDEITRVLLAHGYRVTVKPDGESALAALARMADVALLVTPLMMPGGIAGLDLGRAAQERRAGLPILLLGNKSGSEMALGPGVDVISEPLEPNALIAAISDLLQRAIMPPSAGA